MVPELTVALLVDGALTSRAMLLASGPEDAPELVTAWQLPPDTAQPPSLWLPRGSGDTAGSVPVAAERTMPVQLASPAHRSAAPDAEAADGPDTSRALLGLSDSAWAAPGPVDAVDVDRAWQLPPPPRQLAVPVETRGLPPATAPSQAAELVCTVPEHPALGQLMEASEFDMDDG